MLLTHFFLSAYLRFCSEEPLTIAIQRKNILLSSMGEKSIYDVPFKYSLKRVSALENSLIKWTRCLWHSVQYVILILLVAVYPTAPWHWLSKTKGRRDQRMTQKEKPSPSPIRVLISVTTAPVLIQLLDKGLGQEVNDDPSVWFPRNQLGRPRSSCRYQHGLVLAIVAT